MTEKPFALIGVNVDRYDAKKLKPVMEKETLNWRSFAAGRAIGEKWNAATPTYYVIDYKGVIRYKWVGNPGEKALDAALEKLIQDVEESKPRESKQRSGDSSRPLPKEISEAWKAAGAQVGWQVHHARAGGRRGLF